MCEYVQTRRFKDAFNLDKAFYIIQHNFAAFFMFILLYMLLSLLWTVASVPIITMVITHTANTYGAYYMLADFYRKAKKH